MTGLVIILSLIITGIHIAFAEGMILGGLRVWAANHLDRAIGMKWSRYVQKPLWACLPCMGSVWTIVITRHFDIWLILAVCGLNAIISRLIEQDETVLVTGSEQQTEYHDEIPTIDRYPSERPLMKNDALKTALNDLITAANPKIIKP